GGPRVVTMIDGPPADVLYSPHHHGRSLRIGVNARLAVTSRDDGPTAPRVSTHTSRPPTGHRPRVGAPDPADSADDDRHGPAAADHYVHRPDDDRDATVDDADDHDHADSSDADHPDDDRDG